MESDSIFRKFIFIIVAIVLFCAAFLLSTYCAQWEGEETNPLVEILFSAYLDFNALKQALYEVIDYPLLNPPVETASEYYEYATSHMPTIYQFLAVLAIRMWVYFFAGIGKAISNKILCETRLLCPLLLRLTGEYLLDSALFIFALFGCYFLVKILVVSFGLKIFCIISGVATIVFLLCDGLFVIIHYSLSLGAPFLFYFIVVGLMNVSPDAIWILIVGFILAEAAEWCSTYLIACIGMIVSTNPITEKFHEWMFGDVI
ncbi:MAG: hypothetical protein J5851_09345 [Oscillospiraceae bacterium]|nr:hypothetical protein [Oscillospiraceae bacterium]